MEPAPKVRCVVLDDSSGSPSVTTAFDLTTGADRTSEQLHDLASQLGARLTGLGVDLGVVARADAAPVASKSPARQSRLLVEGALVHAAMTAGVRTLLRNGKEMGAACSSDKQSVLASGKGLDSSRFEACAAGLSGLAKKDAP
jgi:hypothetical protein